MPDSPWMSVDDVAHYLGISKDTVYTWVSSRDLPAHKVGRLWRFKRVEIDDWVRTSSSVHSRKSLHDSALLGSIETVLQNAPCHLVTTNVEGQIVYASRVPGGVAESDILGRTPAELVDEECHDTMQSAVHDALARGTTQQLIVRGTLTGQRYLVTIQPMRSDDDIIGTICAALALYSEQIDL